MSHRSFAEGVTYEQVWGKAQDSGTPSGRLLPRFDKRSAFGHTTAWFLGPRAENADLFKELIGASIDSHSFYRRSFHPNDGIVISQQVKQRAIHTAGVDRLRQEFWQLMSSLKDFTTPYYSMRYQGHMLWDTTLASMIGYFATMLHNPNNVTVQASTLTTYMELMVGWDLCSMLGFPFPDKDYPIQPHGHLTSGGTVANIEATWSARELKFLPVVVKHALTDDSSPLYWLGPKKDRIKVKVWIGGREDCKSVTKLNEWDLLNVPQDEALALPKRILDVGPPDMPGDRGQARWSERVVWELLLQHTVNSIGIAAFYQRFLRKDDAKPVRMPIILAPASKHYSWNKAMGLLGLGSGPEAVVDVKVDQSGRMDIHDLRSKLDKARGAWQPVLAVIAVAGSTEEGAVDNLEEIIDIRKSYREKGFEFNVHVDAAWGGYFAATLRKDFGNPSDDNVGWESKPFEELEGHGYWVTIGPVPVLAGRAAPVAASAHAEEAAPRAASARAEEALPRAGRAAAAGGAPPPTDEGATPTAEQPLPATSPNIRFTPRQFKTGDSTKAAPQEHPPKGTAPKRIAPAGTVPEEKAATTETASESLDWKHPVLLSSYAVKQIKAIRAADSATIDPHKTGYVPYPAGAICYRNSEMRRLVTYGAPVIGTGQNAVSVGEFGIEGSKPGAAAASVFLSHAVVRPSHSGHGQLMNSSMINSKLFYIGILGLNSKNNSFVAVPLVDVPEAAALDGAREDWHSSSCNTSYVDSLIETTEPSKRLLESADLRGFLVDRDTSHRTRMESIAEDRTRDFERARELGPDLNIVDYMFNFRTKCCGEVNRDLRLLNLFNRAIYDRVHVKTGRIDGFTVKLEEAVSDVHHLPLMVSKTDMWRSTYGDHFVIPYVNRLGVTKYGPEPAEVKKILKIAEKGPINEARVRHIFDVPGEDGGPEDKRHKMENVLDCYRKISVLRSVIMDPFLDQKDIRGRLFINQWMADMRRIVDEVAEEFRNKQAEFKCGCSE